MIEFYLRDFEYTFETSLFTDKSVLKSNFYSIRYYFNNYTNLIIFSL